MIHNTKQGTSSTLSRPPVKVRGASPRRWPTSAVTLRNQAGWPLFQWIGQRDPTTTVKLASEAYRHCAVAIAEQRTVGEDREALLHDPSRTIIAPARGRETWRINYFALIAGEAAARETRPVGAIGRAETVGLLQEVAFGDARLLRALISGATIEFCPFHEWSSTSGWVTIDCAFRARRDGRPARDLRPRSPHLRDAVRLIVLKALLRFPASRRQALVDRHSIGTASAQSATIRAMLRSRGTTSPAKLGSWLRENGVHDLADALQAEAKR